MKYLAIGFWMSIGWYVGRAVLEVVSKHLLELILKEKPTEESKSRKYVYDPKTCLWSTIEPEKGKERKAKNPIGFNTERVS